MIRANNWYVPQGQVIIRNVSDFITTSGGTLGTDVRTTLWTDPITHGMNISFGGLVNAQAFFTNGGQIRFSADRVGGSTNDQNTSITNMLANIGTVILDANETTKTGVLGSGTTIGYNDLTNTYQTIFTANSTTSNYTLDEYKIEAKIFPASGVLDVLITITDDSDNVVDESVDGTLTSYIDYRRSVNDANPSYAVTDPLEGQEGGEGGEGGPTSFDEAMVAASPINWWRLDETTGTVAVDSQGNSNLSTVNTDFTDSFDGFVVSTSSTRADGVGKSFTLANADNVDNARFDIVGTQVPVTATTTLQDGDFTFTLAAEKHNSADSGVSNASLISLVNTTINDYQFRIYYHGGTDQLRIESRADSVLRTGVLVSNCSTWQSPVNYDGDVAKFITIECDTTNNQIQTWFDSTLAGTLDITGWSSNWRSDDTNEIVVTGLNIGNDDILGSTWWGAVDEIAYFNKTMTGGIGTGTGGEWEYIYSYWASNTAP
jgi:hypothetical protein